MLRRLLGALPGASPPAEPMLDPARCLFIIGAARTGTTVLQNALNSAPEIFLLGEPQMHLDGEAPGFAARYNAAHRSWHNQETKSSFCPPVLAEDGSWRDYLLRLSATHRWVGAKTVIATLEPEAVEALYAFQCRHFYASRYLLTFRNPLDALSSTRGLQAYTGAEPQSFRLLVAHYADMVALFVRMLRTLPHVSAVIHEDVDAAVLDRVGRWLGVSLTDAPAYYDRARVRGYTPEGLDPAELALLDQVEALFADLRTGVAAGFPLPQLDQNNANLTPGHHTPLGALSLRAATIAEGARRQAGERT